MELSRLDTTLDAVGSLGDALNALDGPLVVSCRDADTVILVASLRDALRRPLGVWLEVAEGYPAALAARDVATLAWLVALDHVVVASRAAGANAEVVRALLTEDEVNLDNEVVTLRGAFNRPAPPRPVTVWGFDGTTLASSSARLVEAAREETPVGVVSRYVERARA